MRIARRYIASEIYRSSAVVLLALLGLFSFFSLIEELDQLSATLSLANLLYLQLLNIPTQLYELLPIGLLIGAVLALAGLAQRNELVILRASGVSGFQLLISLWIITIPLMIGAFVLSEYITPRAEIQSSESSLKLLGKAGGGRLNSGYWFKETDTPDRTRLINITHLRGKSSVADIHVYEFTAEQHLHSYIQAEHGEFQPDHLLLKNVQRSVIDTHALDALQAGVTPTAPIIALEHQNELKLQTSLSAERLLVRVLTPERMAITDLLDYIDYLEINQLQTDRQTVALWRKLAYPFTLLVMITIAAPISFMQTRHGGVGSKIFVGILLGVGFFMANQLALNLGMLTNLQPWLTALFPSIFALTVALIALLFIENSHRWSQRFRREN